jgi:hypothetical protein
VRRKVLEKGSWLFRWPAPAVPTARNFHWAAGWNVDFIGQLMRRGRVTHKGRTACGADRRREARDRHSTVGAASVVVAVVVFSRINLYSVSSSDEQHTGVQYMGKDSELPSEGISFGHSRSLY